MDETPQQAARRYSDKQLQKGFIAEALHSYQDANGNFLYWRIRLKNPETGDKWIRPMKLNGHGYEIGEPEHSKKGKPLYNLPDIHSRTEETVWLVEGEWTVDRLSALGLLATTSGSADSASRADWTPLMGRKVIIWPDNDAAGERYAKDATKRLKAIDANVWLVEIDKLRLPEKADAVDWLQANPDATSGDLIKLPLLNTSVSFVSSYSSLCENYHPQPLPDDIPPVEQFEPALLPESFRPWIEDISDRIQCLLDYPAVSAMIALSAVIGRQCGIRPKKYDTWIEIPNLWGAVIGRPGVLKTPAVQEAMKPLKRLDSQAREIFNSAMLEWEADQLVAKEQKKVTSEEIRKALKRNDRGALDMAKEAILSEADQPIRQRLIVNDATVEKLGEILNQNPRGVLLFRDELSGWLRTLDRQGHEADRGFYLEAWNGKDSYVYDRIGRGTLDIEAACVSILGSIQPGPLSHYMATQGNAGDDGLMQRFQLLVWPDTSGDWKNVDRWPDVQHKNRAYDVFQRLSSLTSEAIKAQRDDDSVIPYLRFAPEAQELFNHWRTELEARLRAGNEHPAIEAHLAKYRGLIPSLALTIHLADTGHGPVSLEALERACAWGEYLESHARRIYSPAMAPDVVAARTLAKHLIAGDLPVRFNLRDVYRPCWTGLSDKDSASKAVSVLVDFDWLIIEEESTGGRPRTWFNIMPGIAEVA